MHAANHRAEGPLRETEKKLTITENAKTGLLNALGGWKAAERQEVRRRPKGVKV